MHGAGAHAGRAPWCAPPWRTAAWPSRSGCARPALFTATFALGGALGALGGILGADVFGINPSYGFDVLVFVQIVVAVAGLGTLRGSFLASLLIGAAADAVRLSTRRRWALSSCSAPCSCCCCCGRAGCSGGSECDPDAAAVSAHADELQPDAAAQAPGALGGGRCRCWRSAAVPLLGADYYALGTQIAVTIIFALSLDLAGGLCRYRHVGAQPVLRAWGAYATGHRLRPRLGRAVERGC